MRVLLKRISIYLLLVMGAGSVFANPGHHRETREASHAARQQQRAVERAENQTRRQMNQEQDRRSGGLVSPDYGGQQASGRENSSNAMPDIPARRPGRLTPEERRALRRQINEAGQDIYVPKR